MSVEDIQKYYADLLIVQYNNQPKAKGTIELISGEFYSDAIFYQVQDAFDIDSAVGAQLDIIGKYAGIDRNFLGQVFPDDTYFQFTDYDTTLTGTEKGFSDYDNYNSLSGYFLNYNDIVSITLKLNDDDFRTLIKLKILINTSDSSQKSIDDDLFLLFGNEIFASFGNMDVTYFVTSQYLQIASIAGQKGALPKPMGVRLSAIIEADNPIFAFTTYTESEYPLTINGMTDYSDYDSEEGQFLTYNDLIIP